ncbi:hypothetical protein ABT095_15015 [Kitasatospora sp. NPDC002227]|uniref:hypothetical protein n=1 Tax=Kitasatospora sp. NPDC002227 TaxID=3154773 RepID=UPI00331E94AD
MAITHEQAAAQILPRLDLGLADVQLIGAALYARPVAEAGEPADARVIKLTLAGAGRYMEWEGVQAELIGGNGAVMDSIRLTFAHNSTFPGEKDTTVSFAWGPQHFQGADFGPLSAQLTTWAGVHRLRDRDRHPHRAQALADFVRDVYLGDVSAVLIDLAPLSLAVAYIDRETVELHLERPLPDEEWERVREHLAGTDYDEVVSETADLQDAFIDKAVAAAGLTP